MYKIKLIPALLEDKTTIQNLGRFYLYDVSRYCGFLEGWKTPENGLFECNDFSRYWSEPNRYPFLLRVNDELAGFILINKIGTSPEVDWNMGEFFILSKFQGKGIGKKVAKQIFDQFPGIWEVRQIPENKPAIFFWNRVIDNYSKGHFEKDLKTIEEPKPHTRVVLKFKSGDS